METITYLFTTLANLNMQLTELIAKAGSWTYLISGFAIFSETGLFFAPFVPGDSLLFVMGLFSSKNNLNIFISTFVLIVSSVLGDNLNYAYGKFFSGKTFSNPNAKFFKPIYLEKTRLFFQKHGKLAIILARFIPVGRIFTPFVAGMTNYSHKSFMKYNFIGCSIWSLLYILTGYFFGRLPMVANNFSSILFTFSIVPLFSWALGYFLQKKLLYNR